MAFNSIANIALRAAPGAFVLNSGVGKLGMDEDSATYLRAEAAKGIPALADMDPKQFRSLVAYGEIAVGSALLLPFVPNRIAGMALGGFSAALLSIYFRDPEKTGDDGVRPSPEGISMAKDAWMAAIAVALMAGGAGSPRKARKHNK